MSYSENARVYWSVSTAEEASTGAINEATLGAAPIQAITGCEIVEVGVIVTVTTSSNATRPIVGVRTSPDQTTTFAAQTTSQATLAASGAANTAYARQCSIVVPAGGRFEFYVETAGLGSTGDFIAYCVVRPGGVATGGQTVTRTVVTA